MDIETILNKKKIEFEDLASIVKRLERIKGIATEEYLMVLQIRLFELIVEDLKVDIGYLKTLSSG